MNSNWLKNLYIYTAFTGSMLVFSGGSCNDDLHRMTPSNDLHYAASTNNLHEIDSALSRGYHVDTTDRVGNTALHIASAYGKVDAIMRLAERGANVHLRDSSGRTPLHIAAPQRDGQIFYRKYLDSMDVLLNAGADINAQDVYGDTALHRAAYWGSIEGARLLMRRGANSWVRNFKNETPADQVKKRLEIAQERLNRLSQEGKSDLLADCHKDIERYHHMLNALQA